MAFSLKAKRCECCDGLGAIDPVPWPLTGMDRSAAGTILAIEASNALGLPVLDIETEIAEAIGASRTARIVAVAAVYASTWKAGDGDDDMDDGGMSDVYGDAASMMETGWPGTRREFAAALDEMLEHGEAVIRGGRIDLPR